MKMSTMEKRSKAKIAMMFGAYYGFSAIIVMMLFYLLNLDPQSKIPSLLNYALLVLFMVLGMRTYRDQDNGGLLSYGEAVGTGLLVSVFGGVILSVFTVVLFTFIDPGMTEKLLEAAREQMIENGTPDSQVEMGLQMAKNMMSPIWLFVLGMLGSAFMGLIFSLIVAIFVRREANPFQSNIG
ncbi:MAG: hypothetical protein RL213_1617 [Bacteroidota bacterium]|jgi:hypothetical protein